MEPSDKTVILAPAAPHTHTVIFLHGRGDTAANFCSSLSRSCTSQGLTLPEVFPSFRWVFPHAPLRKCARFPKGNASPQWFDVWDHRDRSEREDVQVEGLRESVDTLRAVLEREATILEGKWDCIVLAGISQGGATAVHTLLNLARPTVAGPNTGSNDARLGALLGFSTYLPLYSAITAGDTASGGEVPQDHEAVATRTKIVQIRNALGLDGWEGEDEVIRNTPVLLEHCLDDATVFVQLGRELRDVLVGVGATVTWKEYPTGRHWFNSPDGMDDVVRFLDSALGLGMGNQDHSGPIFSGCYRSIS